VNPSAGVKLRTSSANLPSPPLPSANLASPPLHEELQRLAWLRLSGLRAEKEAERHNQLASVYWRYRPPGTASEWHPPWSRHATPPLVMTPWGDREEHQGGVREVSRSYRRGGQLLKHDRESHAKRGSIHPRRCMFMVGNQEFAFMDGVSESSPSTAR